MALIALAIKLDSPGPVLFRQTRVGRDDDPVRDAQVPQHGRRRRRAQGLAARAQRGATACSRSRTTRGSRASGGCCAGRASTSCRSSSTCSRGSMSLVGPRPLVIDEDRHVTGFDRRRLHLTPGHHRPLADARRGARPAVGDGQDRLPLHRELVALGRLQDHRRDGWLRPPGTRPMRGPQRGGVEGRRDRFGRSVPSRARHFGRGHDPAEGDAVYRGWMAGWDRHPAGTSSIRGSRRLGCSSHAWSARLKFDIRDRGLRWGASRAAAPRGRACENCPSAGARPRCCPNVSPSSSDRRLPLP